MHTGVRGGQSIPHQSGSGSIFLSFPPPFDAGMLAGQGGRRCETEGACFGYVGVGVRRGPSLSVCVSVCER